MGPPTVHLVLVVVLGVTATLVHAEGSSSPDELTTTGNRTREGEDNQSPDKTTPLQRRLNGLDTRLSNQLNGLAARLNGLDTRLNMRQNEVNTRLNMRQNEVNTRLNTRRDEVNTRLNRIDDRFDELETSISDMKGYLQTQMEAMGQKVEWAMSGVNPHRQNDPISDVLPGDLTPPQKPRVYQGCQDALTHGMNTSGVYSISLDHNKVIDVYCDQRLDGGGWTVFQARKDGSVDFYQDWNTYKRGFGELTGEFWLGNTNIHLLTKQHDQQLKIQLTSPEGEVKYADYAHFWIDNEAQKFRLQVTGYSGGSPPGDAFTYHSGQHFSTRDQDNDRYQRSCARDRKAAWWYKSCNYSNLNGLYGSTDSKGVIWGTWKGYETSMTSTKMMVRRRP